MQYLTHFGAVVLGVIGLTVAWIKYQENFGIFHPTQYSRKELKRLPESLEFVEFSSADETTITGLLKNGKTEKPVMVLYHGNAGHMLNRIDWFQRALPEGWSGLIVDYRGYGLSEGTPSISGVKKDARASAEYALSLTKNDTLILHGRSLGVPLAASASQTIKTEAIILESGFANAREVASNILPVPGVGSLISVSLNTIDYLEKARRKHGPKPKFILHGTHDRVLPVELGRRLYERAPQPKQWWEVSGAGHNNLPLVAGESYRRRINQFLESALNSNSWES